MAKEQVTFFLYTYNHEDFIGPALDSALAQTYQSMDIFIWDNCSTDKTAEIIRNRLSSYTGPHEVYFHRNDRNLYPGLEMDNLAVPRMKGDFIVPMSGDDVSRPDRVEKLVEASRETGAYALSSANIEIDGQGREGQYISTLTRKNRFALTTLEQFVRYGGSSACLGCGLAYDRKVFDYFGPLKEGPRNNDVMIPFRGALLGCTYFVDQPLVYRRIHAGNVAMQAHKSKAGDEDEQLVVKERQLSNRLANWIAMLEDLDYFIKDNPEDPRDLPKIRQELQDRIIRITKRWVAQRYQMMMKGLGIV